MVGARCAGALTAMLLARRGHKVLVVDRATFDAPVAYGPRRTVLDKLLVDAAAEAGAEVRQGFTVREVVVEGGRVTGVRGHQADGRTELAVPVDRRRVAVRYRARAGRHRVEVDGHPGQVVLDAPAGVELAS